MREEEREKLGVAKLIAKGSIASLMSTGGVKALGVVFYFALLRLLPPEEAGLFFIASAILGFAVLIPSFGIPASIGRFVPYYIGKGTKEKVKPTFLSLSALLLLTSVISSLLLILFSGEIASFYGAPIKNLVILIAVTVPFALFSPSFSCFLRGIKRFVGTAILDLSLYFFKLLFVLLLLFFVSKTGENAFLSISLSTILIALIGGAWSFIELRKFPSGSIDKETFRGFLSFGVPVYLAGFGNMICAWTDTLFLGFFLSVPVVAAYNAVMVIARNIGPLIAAPISSVVSPMLAHMHGKKSPLFKAIAINATKWNFYLGFPVLIVFLAFPYQIMNAIFPDYTSSAWLLYILAPTFFFILLSYPFRNAIAALGRTDIFLKVSIVIIVPNILLNYLLIPPFEMLGAATATAISFISAQCILIYYGRKLANVWFHHDIWKGIASGLVMLAFIFVVKELVTFNLILLGITTVAAGAVYFSSLLLLKGLSKIDWEIITAVKNKMLGLVRL